MNRARISVALDVGSAGGAMRVLHVIDPLSPWAGPCALRLMADFIVADGGGEKEGDCEDGSARRRHDVLIIGRAAEAGLAGECGVNAIGSIWPRGGRVLNAAGALGRWLAAARRRGAAPDVIHAWSGGCGALAALAAPSLPRVVTPHPAAVELESPHLLPREQVRQRWLREDAVQHDEFVIGLLGEHVERFDARRAMHVGARTGLSSRRIRLVMSGQSLGRPEAQRFLAALDLDRAIVQDEGAAQPWKVLRGLDAALLLTPTPTRASPPGSRRNDDLSVLPLLWAWAAGVPVIAEASAPGHALLEHDRTGLMFPTGDLNTGCDRVARLHDDRALARRLAGAGRTVAEQRFNLPLFHSRVEAAYQQAARERRAAYLDVEQPGGQASDADTVVPTMAGA